MVDNFISEKSFLSYDESNMNKHKLYVIGALLILLAGAFFIYNSIVYRTEISDFELEAKGADSAGIVPDSHFILKTTAALTTQVLEKYMKIAPSTKFDVTRVLGSENTYEIIPIEPLKIDQVYTIAVDKGPLASREYSWAYQVKAPFQLISSIPADKGVDVPANTGIELYFNRDNVLNPEKFIQITPAVSGKFEVAEGKVSFIPKNPLSDRTIYTVKIKSGLKAEGTDDTFDSEKVFQFQTSPSYSQTSKPSAYFSRQFAEFNPGADILLGMNAYGMSSVGINVYRFGSAQEFLDSVTKVQGDTPWARYYSNSNDFPPEKKVFSGNIPLEASNYFSTVRLPQALSNGYYAVVTTGGDNEDVSWFQVNPTASFVTFANPKSLVWLKDITSEKNVANVPILFNGKAIGKTGADGVALFDTPVELIRKPTDPYDYGNERKFFVAETSSQSLIIPIETEYGSAATLGQNDKWWSYVSLNKNIYLSNDTLHFWAILKPRDGDISGQDISVKLTNSYWSENQTNIVTLGETTMKVSDYNAVTGDISFSNVKPGVYSLTFRKGDEVVAVSGVTVSAYIKPAYKITAVPDKTALFAGEPVTFKVKAELFDGTPVANTSLSYTAYGVSSANSESTIVLDSNGEGTFTLTPTYSSELAYWPSYMSVTIRPTKSEEGQIATNASVFVFGPHINNFITQKQEASGAMFTVKTRAVVLKSTSRQEPYWNSEDYLGDALGGVSTNVDTSEVIYLKNQTGTGYDPINKLSYPIYNYTTEYHPISSQAITSNGDGLSEFTFHPEDKKTYRFIFTTPDTFGRRVTETRFVYGGLDQVDLSYGQDASYYLSHINGEDNKSYKIGESVNLQLQTSEGTLPPQKEGNYIFMTVHNGNVEYKVGDSPKYHETFEEKDVPNVSVWPGWFSQGRFHNSYLQNISFDANERRLNVTVTKDKQTYKPGDEVNLDIKVTDKNNMGTQAEVNISALDEAVFAVRPDEIDVIDTLYRDIYSQVIIRTSNALPYGGGGAEKGGGDGDTPRSNIQELAIYKSVTTDSSGYAHVQFKLPDNITSWRVTSQAVTEKLSAGKSVSFIPVTLPFFVDATLNNTYLAGDDLTLRLRTFGTAALEKNISYFAESLTLPFKKIQTSGGNKVEMHLGSLTAGNHSVTVGAESGGLKDSLVRPLHVLNSYFTKNSSDFYPGVNGLKIKNNAAGLTTLTFGSEGRGKLYNVLKSLSYQSGVRLDQKGSELTAKAMLNTYFGENNELPELQATKYQAYSGGLQLLPYSSDDLEFSAIAVHALGASFFDQASLKNYFRASLSDTKSDAGRIARALYGLTMFDDPVLTKIERIKDDTKLTLRDKVFVALALDSIGAKEQARVYYKTKILPAVEMKGSYAYVGGLKGDDTIITTSLLSALSASLEEPEAEKLAMYASENFPKEDLSNFERLLYVKFALPKLSPEEVSFSYKAGSKTGSKTLKDGESFELTLSPQDLADFSLSDVKGRLGVTASYEEPSTPASIVKDSNLSIGRSYFVNGGATNQFNDGDVVMVKLDPRIGANALSGSYQIVDYLPSGLRPVDTESDRFYSIYDSRVYPTEINDQKVTFIIDKTITLPVYYYARVVSKGTYKAEPAILQSLRSLGSKTITNENSVTVK